MSTPTLPPPARARGALHAPAARHRALLASPWYAGTGEGSTLHHYEGSDFVPRFLADAAAARLTGTAAQRWYAQDRFGRYADHPTLRLPLHKSFYLLSCELVCDAPGGPAWDPARVLGAGLVVRRLGSGTAAPERWMQADGVPLGWRAPRAEELLAPDAEPDLGRRLRVLAAQSGGASRARLPEPAPSGEVHAPMHALLVRRALPDGRVRAHTLLWGYLPLGGAAREAAPAPVPGPAEGGPDLAAELDWPFGDFGITPAAPRAWAAADGLVVQRSRAVPAMAEWLRMLLGRHRIADATDPDNGELRERLASIWFVRHRTTRTLADHAGGSAPADRTRSVLEWLAREAEPLQGWLARLDRGAAAATLPLPGLGDEDLYLVEAAARQLRELLVLRSLRALARSEAGLELPRFGPGPDERFVARPFMRWMDDCGCERVAFGPASLPFRVAAPLDPQAQRPQTIVLPSLADLKRGTPNGVALLAPKSLADVLLKIKPEMPPVEAGSNRAGLCFSFNFSLPVITICAMVLLMIILSLLNLIFFWLPWAFLALPRLCLKALRE